MRLRGRRLCISDKIPGEVEAAGLGTFVLEPLALSRRGERCRGDKVCLTWKTTEALSESSGSSGGVCLGALPRRAVRPQSSDGIWDGRWRAFPLCPSPRAPATGSLGILGLGVGWCYWGVTECTECSVAQGSRVGWSPVGSPRSLSCHLWGPSSIPSRTDTACPSPRPRNKDSPDQPPWVGLSARPGIKTQSRTE